MCGGANDLTGLRSGEAKLMRERVNAAGLRELRFGKPELPVLFAHLLELLFF